MVAPIRILGEKVRWISSSANMIPDSGALNAAESPAEAPAVIRQFSSSLFFPAFFANAWLPAAPIWMDGPSLPRETPKKDVRIPARYRTISTVCHFIFIPNRTIPSTCGIPLPFAYGSSFTSR